MQQQLISDTDFAKAASAVANVATVAAGTSATVDSIRAVKVALAVFFMNSFLPITTPHFGVSEGVAA